MSASIASYAAKVNEEQVVGLAVVGLRLAGLVVDGLEVVGWNVGVMDGLRDVGLVVGDDGLRDVGLVVVGLVVGVLSRVGEYVG